MKRAEVFTPNALPSVTFVEEHLKDKKKLLLQNLEQGGAVIAISGPSKSGKTVFVETTLGHGSLIQVSGANIGTPDELWRRIFAVVGTPIPTTKTIGKSEESAVTGSVEGGVPLVVKGAGSVGGKWGSTSGTTMDVKPDYLGNR